MLGLVGCQGDCTTCNIVKCRRIGRCGFSFEFLLLVRLLLLAITSLAILAILVDLAILAIFVNNWQCDTESIIQLSPK